ncbi:MAG TPA: TetR/AcrR family transcriptional regulator [Pyrinomonadaceae bacterium]|nr:TetR/AcrR family transcriptional regulator [Pyrinomonadaceae bacterium]
MIREIEKTEAVSGRMSGDERRSQILQIAIGLFSQKGFSGTTTKEIAAAAGVSEAMVFRHFANKDELYSAILDHKACNRTFQNPFEEIGEKIKAKDDFGVFYTMALNALDHHSEDCGFLRLMLHSALEDHDLARMFFESFITDVYKFLGGYIRQRQADGAFRAIEPHVVVRAFVGMFVHHSLNNLLWDKEQKLLKISNEEAAKNFTEILLRGIAAK